MCGGDGDSCLECQSANLSLQINSLDGSALSLLGLARRIRNGIRRGDGLSRSDRANFARAQEFYTSSWSSINTVPSVAQSCANRSFCVSAFHGDSINTYEESMELLSTQIRRLIRSFRRSLIARGRTVAAANRRAARMNDRRQDILDEALVLSSSLPTESDNC